jgi:S-adenosylmethionine hydrolase
LVTSNIPQDPSVVDGVLVGQVISVDHFGNLVTNIAVGELALAQVTVITAGRIVPLVETYAEAPPQQLAALFGSDGYLELAIKNGSAADFLDADTGLVVQVDLG